MNRFFFLLLLLTSFATAQEVDRVLLEGQVHVPPGDDPSGITVFNSATGQGTVTQHDGAFGLMVATGDSIQFSAVQYDPFVIRIDARILDAGQLNVYVSASITELPEVRVGEPDLSGNIEVDVRRIPTDVPDLPVESAADINEFEWEFRPDPQTSPENVAMGRRGLQHGLNFVNIFKGLYNSFNPERGEDAAIEQNLRALYDDSFFQENLQIPREDIHDFIMFTREQGLDQELLEEGNELELMEFLVQASRKYQGRSEQEGM